MVVVGSGLRYHVDDACVAGSADLRSETSRGDLKFLDGILGKIGERTTHNFVVLSPPSHGDVSAAAEAARRTYFQGIGFVGSKFGAGRFPELDRRDQENCAH